MSEENIDKNIRISKREASERHKGKVINEAEDSLCSLLKKWEKV